MSAQVASESERAVLLSQFIRSLRVAEVRISTAEVLDAYKATACIGWRDKSLLKDSLAASLAKTIAEKSVFDAVFERFFQIENVESGAQEKREGNECNEDDNADDTIVQSALSHLLMSGNQVAIDQAVAQAGRAVQVDQISVFTQKGLYSRRLLDEMGQETVQADIRAARAAGRQALAETLKERLAFLRDKTRHHVEKQFLLYADVEGVAVREELLSTVKLSQIEHRHLQSLERIIQRMAKKLATRYKARIRRKKTHRLDLSRMLRYNMRFNGVLFKLFWHSRKKTQPKIFVICDVSGSVASYARFMLMFLYALEAVLPKMRAFAFSSRLQEVTEELATYEADEAMVKILHCCAGGVTDYGQALNDFHRLCFDDVDHLSTIIILGDGRNNYSDPRTGLLQRLYHRADRVIWLNPESPYSWALGDAEIQRYQPFCHQLMTCNSLKHLEKLAGQLLQVV